MVWLSMEKPIGRTPMKVFISSTYEDLKDYRGSMDIEHSASTIPLLATLNNSGASYKKPRSSE
jgi:hypothetical protein